MTAQEVTGKQVLGDCVTLAKDLCVYVVDLGKRAYEYIGKVLKKDKPTEQSEKQ